MPKFAEFETAAGRQIPVVLLERVRAHFIPEGDGAVSCQRQSHYTDESLSAETQDGHNTRWCMAYDVPVVASVEDLHVSGDLDPFKREGLREWLSDAPPRPWKTLIVAKLDRISRNALDTLTGYPWHASALRAVLEHPDLVKFGIFEPAEQAEISARLEVRTPTAPLSGPERPRAFAFTTRLTRRKATVRRALLSVSFAEPRHPAAAPASNNRRHAARKAQSLFSWSDTFRVCYPDYATESKHPFARSCVRNNGYERII